jgi:hypothetical protein
MAAAVRLFLGCGFFSFPVLELDELPLDPGDFDFFGLDPFFFFSLTTPS